MIEVRILVGKLLVLYSSKVVLYSKSAKCNRIGFGHVRYCPMREIVS